MDATNASNIKKQIEFYFSDSNLYRDNFLLNYVHSNPLGFVDLSLLCSFARMRKLLHLSSNENEREIEASIYKVAEALKDSDMLIVSEDKRRVRRAQPLMKSQAELSYDADKRSLYATPFPYDETLDSLMNFFSNVGKVNSIRMRRHLSSKDFKGSIFIEFASADEAQRVRGLSLEYAGAPIRFQPKLEFIQLKGNRDEKAILNRTWQRCVARPTARVGERPTRLDSNKRRREEDLEEGEISEGEISEGDPSPKHRASVFYTPGCVMEFDFGKNASFGGQVVTFGLVKDSLGGKEAGLLFVDYQQGQKVGQARFESPQAAQRAMNDGMVSRNASTPGNKTRLIAGFEATVRILQGREEDEFYERVQAAREKRANEDRDVERERNTMRGGYRGRGGGRGRGRGRGEGRGGGRGGGRGRDRGEKRQRHR